MSSVGPPPPPVLPTPAGGAPAAVITAVLPSPPASVAQLPAGTVLQGIVQALPNPGQAVLQTASGTVTLKGVPALPVGATLSVQIQGQSPQQTQVLLLALNGRPLAPSPASPPTPRATPQTTSLPPQIAQTTTQGQPPSPGPQAAGPDRPVATITPGSGLAAIIVRPAPSVAGPLPAANVPPLATGHPATATPAATTSAPVAAPTSGASGQGPAAAPAAALPAGSELSVRLVAAGAPGRTEGTMPGQTMTGTVTGATPKGQTLVQTPLGLLSLATREPLQPGSALRLEILARPSPVALSREALPLPATGWPALDEAITALQSADPRAARSFVDSRLAPPGSHLATQMVRFLGLLRNGDVKAWLGDDAVKALERAGQKNLIGKLQSDVREFAQRAAEPTGPQGEWRMMAVPFFNGREIENIRLFVRKADDDGASPDGAEGNPGTRFVVEVALTRLGSLQLDGRFRSKQFDLMIRSHDALPDGVRDGIRKVFADSCAALGLAGTVGFQVTPQFVVTADEPPPLAGGLLV